MTQRCGGPLCARRAFLCGVAALALLAAGRPERTFAMKTTPGDAPLAEKCALKTPKPDDLTRGARWEVEGMPLPIAMRAAANVLGIDVGKRINDGWSTDYAYVLTGAACGDLFDFGLHVKVDGSSHEVFRRYGSDRHARALRYGLEALGQKAEVLVKGRKPWTSPESVKRRVAATLALAGRPVLVVGLPKPEHVALITGYEQGGDVLLGWSCEGGGPPILFEPDKQQRFTGWADAAEVIALPGGPLPARDEARVYRQAIARGVQMLQRKADGPYLAGQPLLEAWAKAFEEAKDEAGITKARALIDPYVWDLAERRHYAGKFAHKAASVLPDSAADLEAAATSFGAMHDLMWDVFRAAGEPSSGDQTAKLAEAGARKRIAELIRQAAAHERKAVERLTAAAAGGKP